MFLIVAEFIYLAMQILPSKPNLDAVCFIKAKLYYKFGFYIFIWLILYPQIAKTLPQNSITTYISALIVVVPWLAEYFLIPMALINIVKSYRRNEPHNKYRMFYLLSLIIIALVLVLFLISILGDIGSTL
ncbi:hypothetical protein A0256_18880 [Mucilaginibacter sp. PAMC 26640]|nr:hypothetical protein A0256_18880 [Mucilaginibacter sp. PAMC 26640]